MTLKMCANIWLRQLNTNTGRVQTLNNTLDDGHGNMTLFGTGIFTAPNGIFNNLTVTNFTGTSLYGTNLTVTNFTKNK